MQIGYSLEWEELPSGQDSRIARYLQDVDPTDVYDWPHQHRWLAKTLNELHGYSLCGSRPWQLQMRASPRRPPRSTLLTHDSFKRLSARSGQLDGPPLLGYTLPAFAGSRRPKHD